MICDRKFKLKTDTFGVELIVGGYASLAREIRTETHEKMKNILIKPINIFLQASSQKLIVEIEDLKKFPFTRYTIQILIKTSKLNWHFLTAAMLS
jgi:hypothetical protein